MSEKKNYKLEIPSSQNHLARADRFLEDHLKEHGIDEDSIADLAISATELINNAIIHGNKSNPDKIVTIELEFSDKHLSISITDQGPGFKPENIPSPISDENILKEAGRGIFIVRSLVDDLQVEEPPEGGTRMIIIKNLAS
jgi:serine/threonine-protein kinase RsbW